MLWTSLDDHRHGRGFYSDPLGKPSVLTHWGHFAAFTYRTLTLFPQPTTDEGLAAAGVPRRGASAPAWDEDGVRVRQGPQHPALQPQRKPSIRLVYRRRRGV